MIINEETKDTVKKDQQQNNKPDSKMSKGFEQTFF